MKYEWIDEFLLKKAGVTKDIQEEWNWIRYHIGGKMFAAICRDDDDIPVYITLKLEPVEGEYYRKEYEDIIPGYYMNKEHWNSVKADGNVSDDVMEDLLDKAYRIVFGSLTKKLRRQIIEDANLDNPISACGADCSKCGLYENRCEGCNASRGMGSHSSDKKECPAYACCRIKNCFVNCGECNQFPCKLIYGTKNPGVSDEEFEEYLKESMSRLQKNR
ncbi:MAG: MmcQ/YjbR family DNA-binding protein [Eubacterium sp.]|nr:MmcQ/YjbR family DNA-binding protein [Eubacterium sp.]